MAWDRDTRYGSSRDARHQHQLCLAIRSLVSFPMCMWWQGRVGPPTRIKGGAARELQQVARVVKRENPLPPFFVHGRTPELKTASEETQGHDS